MLRFRLDELKGFSTLVPGLVKDDRDRRYEMLKKTVHGASEDDLLALYEQDAGPEEGEGHADFERACFAASIFLAWDTLFAYLARTIVDHEMGSPSPEKRRAGVRQFRDVKLLKKRWKAAGVDLTGLPTWEEVNELRLLRNALAHNGGRYTAEYLRSPLARRRPDLEEEHNTKLDDGGLVDLFEIPIDTQYVRERLDQMHALFDAAEGKLKT